MWANGPGSRCFLQSTTVALTQVQIPPLQPPLPSSPAEQQVRVLDDGPVFCIRSSTRDIRVYSVEGVEGVFVASQPAEDPELSAPCCQVPLVLRMAEAGVCVVERGEWELPRACADTLPITLPAPSRTITTSSVSLKLGPDLITMVYDGCTYTTDDVSCVMNIGLLNNGQCYWADYGVLRGAVFVDWVQRDLTALSTPLGDAAHVWHLPRAHQSATKQSATKFVQRPCYVTVH